MHFPESTRHRCDRITPALPGSCPLKGHQKKLTSEIASEDAPEFQDSCPAAPPSSSTEASSCCPRDRLDFDGRQAMPQHYSALGRGQPPGALRVAIFLLWLPSWLPE